MTADGFIDTNARLAVAAAAVASDRLSVPQAAALRRSAAPLQGNPMTQDDLLQRITARPEVFGGKPIVRDLRISVEMILSLLAQGESADAILSDYPGLEPADINACLAYAHAVIAHDRIDRIAAYG